MDRPPLPRSRLNLWALTVIAQAVFNADHNPVTPTPRLRLAMGWLAASTGETATLDLLWRDARDPIISSQTDYIRSYIRCTNLRLRLQMLCERMGASYEQIAIYARGVNAEWP